MKKRMLSALLAVCMMLTLLPTTALAASEPTSLLQEIRDYGLTATWDGTDTVTVTGTKENATETLKLEIPKGITVVWKANLIGDLPYIYGLVELSSPSSELRAPAEFTIEEGGIIENSGGPALGVYPGIAPIIEGKPALDPVFINITVDGGTVRNSGTTNSPAQAITIDCSGFPGGGSSYNPLVVNLTVNSGLVETTELNATAIEYPVAYYSPSEGINGGNICINGGVVRAAENGTAIDAAASPCSVAVTVNGGLVESRGIAIDSLDNVTVTGGVIVGTNVGIQHGQDGYDQSSVTIENGTVFGRNPVKDSDFSLQNYSGDGVLISLTESLSQNNEFEDESNEGLDVYPQNASAVWDRQMVEGKVVGGITYASQTDPTNKGFFTVPGAIVNGAAARDFTADDLIYTIPTGHVYNGSKQGIGEVTLKGALASKGEVTQVEYYIEYSPGSIGSSPAIDGVTSARTYVVKARVESKDPDYNTTVVELGKYTIAKAKRVIELTDQTTLNVGGEPVAPIVIADNAKDDINVFEPYDFISSNEEVIKVYLGDTIYGTVEPVGAGEATVTVTTFSTYNYEGATLQLDFKVNALPSQNVTFAQTGPIEKNYGDSAFTNAATNNTSGGGAITYSSSDENVATVNATTGEVTIAGAGTATITATAAAVDGYAETPASYTLTVNPKDITAAATVENKTYDGTTAATVDEVTFTGLVTGENLTEGTDYTVEAAFENADAGTDKTVNVTITLLNKNYKLDGTPITATATISKATLPGMNTTLLMEQTAGFKRALDLSTVAGLPEGETPTFTVQGPGSDYQGLESAAVEANTLTLTTKAGGTYDSGDTVTVNVTGMKNYENSAITVQVTYTNKTIVAISGVTIEEKTYDGTAVTYTGEPTATKLSAGTEVTDEITYDYAYYKIGEEGALTEAPKDAGSYKLVISVAESNKTYTGTVEIPFTIDPAVITIKADDVTAHVGDSVPTRTAYTVTGLVEDEALATEPTLTYMDAEGNPVTPDMSKEGTYTIQASGAAVPEGGNYQEQIIYKTGTLTVSARPVTPDDGDDDNGSSNSGNSGGTTYTATVNKTGNGDVSVSPRNAKKGDKVTITVDPDAGYEVASVTVTDNSGKTIAVSNEGNGKYTFTQPGSRVAIQVTFRNTTEQPGDTVPFTDVATGEWYYEAVQYVYNNELMNGMSATTFEPNSTTTRGMIVTMLYRLENEPAAASAGFTDVAAGQWYTDAVNWAAANNIVNGYGDSQFGPTDTITREQMAAILYRYAQYKGYDVTASADLSAYTDAASVSSYAVSAMQWAVGEGLINGVTNTTLVPGGSATRAQVAAILMRFCENVAK